MKASELLARHAQLLDDNFGEFTAPAGVEPRLEVHTSSRQIVAMSIVLDATVEPAVPRTLRVTRTQSGELVLSGRGVFPAQSVVSSTQEACDLLAQALES